MAHGFFRPYAISALGGFSPGSFQPYVSGRLIETVRYIIYNRVMAFDSCQNFRRLIFILLLDNYYHFSIYKDICHAQLRSNFISPFAKNIIYPRS